LTSVTAGYYALLLANSAGVEPIPLPGKLFLNKLVLICQVISADVLQLTLGLTDPQQSQLKLEPSHLPDAKDLEHIQLEIG